MKKRMIFVLGMMVSLLCGCAKIEGRGAYAFALVESDLSSSVIHYYDEAFHETGTVELSDTVLSNRACVSDEDTVYLYPAIQRPLWPWNYGLLAVDRHDGSISAMSLNAQERRSLYMENNHLYVTQHSGDDAVLMKRDEVDHRLSKLYTAAEIVGVSEYEGLTYVFMTTEGYAGMSVSILDEDLKQADQMIIMPDRTGLPDDAYCRLHITFGAVDMLRIGNKVYIPCYLESYLPGDDDRYMNEVYAIEVIDLKSREARSISVCDMDDRMPQMQLYDLGNGMILINEPPWLDYYGTDPFMGSVFLMNTETESIRKMDIPAGQYAMVKDAQLYQLYEDRVDVYDISSMTKTESHPLSKAERMDWCLIFAGE